MPHRRLPLAALFCSLLALGAAQAVEAAKPRETASAQNTSDGLASLQRRLTLLGFDTGGADGQLGDKTREAIKAFQKKNKLKVTGQPSAELRVQVERESLRLAQSRLQTLGYDPGTADGRIGDKTRNAIRAFQKASGQNPSGNLDDNLLLALSQAKNAARSGDAALPTAADDIRVRSVQIRLAVLGYQPGAPDGKLDNDTRNAIRAFQKKQGLKASGEITPELSARLEKESVRLAQTRLKAMGYRIGRVDGLMGSATRNALKSFQQRASLPATGTLSDATLQRLTGRRERPGEETEVARSNRATPQPALEVPAEVRGTTATEPNPTVTLHTAPAPLPQPEPPTRLTPPPKLPEPPPELSAPGSDAREFSSVSAGREDTIQGRLSFQGDGSGGVAWCAIGTIKLNNDWCSTFQGGQRNQECSVTLRSGRVVAVKCS
ncbi:MAG TPA: peptidoglycan-binding domain-containing protein [Candidatus Competibacteraceae bacterium]|nr:peptidoglycan-binding domain-containing protein [Candidatus Competibacteraceae bacterium]